MRYGYGYALAGNHPLASLQPQLLPQRRRTHLVQNGRHQIRQALRLVRRDSGLVPMESRSFALCYRDHAGFRVESEELWEAWVGAAFATAGRAGSGDAGATTAACSCVTGTCSANAANAGAHGGWSATGDDGWWHGGIPILPILNSVTFNNRTVPSSFFFH